MLNLNRGGRLYNVWDRLNHILEIGRVTVNPNTPIASSSAVSNKQEKDFTTKVKEAYQNVKKTVKKVLIKEKAT